MPTTSVAVRLGVEGQAELKAVFDEAGKSGSEAFKGVAESMNKAGEAADKLRDKVKKTSDETKAASKTANDDPVAARRIAERANALRAAIDPLGAAGTKTEDAISKAGQLLKAGAITTEEHSKAVGLLREEYDKLKEKLTETAGITGLSNAQAAESVHILKSVFDEVQAGSGIFRALQVEGGRIAQVFTEGQGGVAGTLKAYGGYLAALVSPTAALTAGTLALGVAAAFAYSSFENSQAGIARSVQGTGRAAGSTIQAVNDIGRIGAQQAGISTASGRDLAAGFTKEGITADTAQALVANTRRFALAANTDNASAGETLAKAFASPSKGAEQLDGTLGFLNDRLKNQLETLEAQGRLDEARKVLSDAVNKALADTTDQTTRFGRALDGAKNFFANLIQKSGAYVASVIDKPTSEQSLASAQAQLVGLNRSGVLTDFQRRELGPGAASDLDAQKKALQEQIAGLQAKVTTDANNNAAAAARAKTAADNDALSRQVGPLVRSLLPELRHSEDAENAASLFRQTLANPDVLKSLGVSSVQVNQAASNSAVRNQYSDPIQNLVTDSQLRIKSINDYTIAERVATTAQQDALRVLRETGDIVQANTAAENARNEIIAKANDAADTRRQQAEQDLAQVGLSGYAARQQAITNRYEGVGGFDKDEATKSQIATAFQPTSNLIKSAGEEFKQSVIEAATAFKSIEGTRDATGGLSGVGGFDLNQGGATAVQIAAAKLLVAKGATPAAASGFIGRLTTESGPNLDPNAINPTSGAFGVFQDLGSRKSGVLGSGDLSRGGQFTYFLHELQTTERAAGKKLFTGTDVQSGVDANVAFERPGAAAAAAKNPLALSRGNAILAALNGTGSDAGVSKAIAIPQTALTTGADNKVSQADEHAVETFKSIQKPLDDANQSIDLQLKLLGVQQSTLGKSTSQIAGASAAQELLNKFQADSVPITADLTAKAAAYGDRIADLTKKQEDLKKAQQGIIAGQDAVRSGFGDGLKTFVNDLEHGKSAGSAFRDVLSGLGAKLQDFGLNLVTKGLFGGQGQSGGGLFGSLLGGLGGLFHFAHGTEDTGQGGLAVVGEQGREVVNLPPHAQVIPNSIAFGRAPQPAGAVYNAAPTNLYVASDVPEQTLNRMQAMLRDSEARTQKSFVRNSGTLSGNAQQYTPL